jgi:hypothetical protein
MDTSQGLTVFLIICGLSIIIGLVAAGLVYLTTSSAHNDRRMQERPVDVPPPVISIPDLRPQAEPLPTPWPSQGSTAWPEQEPVSAVRPGAHIRFGSEPTPSAPLSPDRLRWGDDPAPIPPINTNGGPLKCPVCRQLSPSEPEGIKCDRCGTIYHTNCWNEVDQVCPMCHQS